MSGLEKIIEAIENENNGNIIKIKKQADEEIKQIIDKATKEAEEQKQSILDKADAKCKQNLENAISFAKTEENRSLLFAKVSLINEVISSALEAVRSLPDGEYFNILKRLIVSAAGNSGGEVFFSENDLSRITDSTVKELENCGITVSKAPAKIKDGFILKQGDIEYNGTFDAVTEAKNDILKDKIAKVLFD